VAVADLGLHAQRHAQVFDRSGIGLAQHCQSLVAALALCVLSQASAADDIGSSYARVDTQCDEGIRAPCFLSAWSAIRLAASRKLLVPGSLLVWIQLLRIEISRAVARAMPGHNQTFQRVCCEEGES
jgi:hypothetical protein